MKWEDIDKDYEEKKEELEYEYEEESSGFLRNNPEPDYNENPEAFEEWVLYLDEIDKSYYYELDQLEQEYQDEQHSYEEELMDLVSKLYNKLDDFIDEQNNENLEITRSESRSMKKGRFNSEYFYITLEAPSHYFSYTIRFADHSNRDNGYDTGYDVEDLEGNFDNILEEIKNKIISNINIKKVIK